MLLTPGGQVSALGAGNVGGKRDWAFEEPFKLQLRALGPRARPSLSTLDGAGSQVFLL